MSFGGTFALVPEPGGLPLFRGIPSLTRAANLIFRPDPGGRPLFPGVPTDTGVMIFSLFPEPGGRPLFRGVPFDSCVAVIFLPEPGGRPLPLGDPPIALFAVLELTGEPSFFLNEPGGLPLFRGMASPPTECLFILRFRPILFCEDALDKDSYLRGRPLPLFCVGLPTSGWILGLPRGLESFRFFCRLNLNILSASSSGVRGIFLGRPGILIFLGRPRFFTFDFSTVSGEKKSTLFDVLAFCVTSVTETIVFLTDPFGLPLPRLAELVLPLARELSDPPFSSASILIFFQAYLR